MRGIRLKGLAGPSGGTNSDALQRVAGYRLVREGDDWVIPDNDPALRAGPRPVIQFPSKPFELKTSSLPVLADQIVAEHLATDLEQHLRPPPERISVDGGFGMATQLREIQYRYFFPRPEQLKHELVNSILPRMMNEFRARFVLPVRIDASYQQAMLSIPKIALLIKKFGGELAGRRIFENRALSSILPTPVDILGYLDGLLFVAPHTFALPLTRPGSALYFLSNGAWQFPQLASENVFEILASDSEPTVHSTVEGFFAPPGPRGHVMRMYVVSTLDALNGLMTFLNDPRNVVDKDGEFDTGTNVQAQCSLRLMFADLLAMNFTGAFHVKHRLAFLFLDKLANLISLFSRSPESETDIFKRLLSLETGDLVAAIVAEGAKSRHKQLSEHLRASITLTWQRVHEHVTSNTVGTAPDENSRLAQLRTLRNLGHGTKLHGAKFQETFLQGALTTPSELIYLPLLAMLALCHRPEKMLGLR